MAPQPAVMEGIPYRQDANMHVGPDVQVSVLPSVKLKNTHFKRQQL